ncbi:malto-oligosyltrehalose trehalohydrolase [Paraflavitalea soli]|uniref:Malto-oligosyltrehalose trehalohydrolase n=1 Tax=Paraflavitalea soli TaxID=2315862 RepID=A0A3B7MEF5_9BACT|nr:malto-oligosyltrehalose trehalohydrolase [Paraflavitalea soli]AXY72714.1 malto-oligosyltrehalose trehalohydrolase [Paraflavitalea soli]
MNDNWPDVGAFYHAGNTCTFTVWSPLSQSVSLLINGQQQPLLVDERGYWQVTLPGIEPGNQYQYVLDGGDPLPDPASCWQPKGVHGPSAVADPSFTWTDQAWKGRPLGELVIYELHTGTFTPEGTFDGIIRQLGYLQQLGINAIELMPVAAFAGDRNWGYDGVFPFAVHTVYGGISGLKQLVNEAHRRGIAVILDVVYNHLGPDGNYFSQYGPYFTDKYKSVWARAINFDDAYCDGVRQYFWQNALRWLDEFHIDGLRLDAVHAIWDAGADHFLAALQRKVEALEKQTGRHKLLIAEFDLNDPRYVERVEKGGLGLASQWVDEFHHALHAIVTGEKEGYYEDFGEYWHLQQSLRSSYVYIGQYSRHRKKHFGALPAGIPYSRFVAFAQNHDQVGNRLLGDRLTTTLSFEALKLVAATLLLSPHVPLLFMGEEYGEQNPFQYFVSHTDPALIEAVRKGRREEFKHFNWQGEIPDPAAIETFNASKLSWNYSTDPRAQTLLRFYQYLIALRKSSPALCCTGREHLDILPIEDTGIIAFKRCAQDLEVLVFLNFNKQSAACTWPLPPPARRLLDSSEKTWLGPGSIDNGGKAGTWTMNPESVIVYELSNA